MYVIKYITCASTLSDNGFLVFNSYETKQIEPLYISIFSDVWNQITCDNS